MFRRFHHGHSLGLGALLMLLIQRNGWLILVGALLIFAAGIVAGRMWLTWQRLVAVLSANLAAKTRNVKRRYKSDAQTEEIPY